MHLESMFQYGNSLIGNMGKKKKEEVLLLDNDGILSQCATSLDTAFTYAVEHRDVEAMLAVSDRWLRLYAMLSHLEEDEKETLKLGFIDDNEKS
jgi:hypothetical protein